MDFVRPEIVEDSMILIQGGRHLLQELTVEGPCRDHDVEWHDTT